MTFKMANSSEFFYLTVLNFCLADTDKVTAEIDKILLLSLSFFKCVFLICIVYVVQRILK